MADQIYERTARGLGGMRRIPGGMLCVTNYVAMLRAVNVAGTGKLPMTELKAIGVNCGFSNVRTFIASGNLLFESDLDEDEAARRVGAGLEAFFGKPVPLFVRSAAEMAAVAAGNRHRSKPAGGGALHCRTPTRRCCART